MKKASKIGGKENVKQINVRTKIYYKLRHKRLLSNTTMTKLLPHWWGTARPSDTSPSLGTLSTEPGHGQGAGLCIVEPGRTGMGGGGTFPTSFQIAFASLATFARAGSPNNPRKRR